MERRAAIFSVNVARERKNRELQRYIEGSFGGIGKIAAVGRPRQGLVKKVELFRGLAERLAAFEHFLRRRERASRLTKTRDPRAIRRQTCCMK